jgi:hypothetical protein
MPVAEPVAPLANGPGKGHGHKVMKLKALRFSVGANADADLVLIHLAEQSPQESIPEGKMVP